MIVNTYVLEFIFLASDVDVLSSIILHSIRIELSTLHVFVSIYCLAIDIKLYCIVLYCIVLYCIALYCIALYCIVLYCIVLYCIVLYCNCNCIVPYHIATAFN